MVNNIWRQCPSDTLTSSDIIDCQCSAFKTSESIVDGFFEFRATLKYWNGSEWKIKPMKTFKNSIWAHKPLKVYISGNWELVRS